MKNRGKNSNHSRIDGAVKTKAKPEINREKVELLKQKFKFIKKVKPLKFGKKKSKAAVSFDPKTAKPLQEVDMAAIWEKSRSERTMEEKYYYRKEKKFYHRHFFLYLAREMRRVRWVKRKPLSYKFLITISFITFFASLFAVLNIIINVLKVTKMF